MPDDIKEVLNYLRWIIKQSERGVVELKSIKVNYETKGIKKVGEWSETK